MAQQNAIAEDWYDDVNRILEDEKAKLRIKEKELEIEKAVRDELELEIYRKIAARLGGNE